jgi:hypothetical protein
VPFYQGLHAEIKAQDDAEGALIRIDEALALADETEERWSDAFLHRCRGEILLKRDAANMALAEDAFLAAISIAQRQKARSFELRAALSLAKLYHSTGRRRPCRARVGAQGLLADRGISRDRGSANASQRAGVVSQSREPATSLLGPFDRSKQRVTEPKTGPAAPKSAAQPTFATARRRRRRTTLPHGDVLRPSGLNRHSGSAGCRVVARPRERLSRKRLGGGDGDGRPRSQKTRRTRPQAASTCSSSGYRDCPSGTAEKKL